MRRPLGFRTLKVVQKILDFAYYRVMQDIDSFAQAQVARLHKFQVRRNRAYMVWFQSHHVHKWEPWAPSAGLYGERAWVHMCMKCQAKRMTRGNGDVEVVYRWR